MSTLTPRDRMARRLRAGALALASALALAACEAQPVGSFQNAEFVADGSRALQSVYFQPGQPALRAGEAERIRCVPVAARLITPETDILLHVGRTGSPLLDARRRGTLRASHAAHAGAGAAGRRRQHARGGPHRPTRRRSRWCSTTGWW